MGGPAHGGASGLSGSRHRSKKLIPRLADIRLTGDVPRVRSNFVNGIKKLPVEVTLT
ncbi:hypothetical protein [Streptomyces sp. NRRL S-475]|uniref:hypothetical protein n=1 Tax=Streptomyces sp. NRRL S-475 TaxID=1463910 RepID=UPI000AC6A887|nr:hypothetical protein [Streptomyces sp. NRRL S-475]